MYCGKRIQTVPDNMKPGFLSSATRPDRVCESSLRTCRVRARQEGDQCTPGEIQEMRSMTGSLHWVTGGTRPDEAFATSQLQRIQSAPLVSDHKRAVQTIKRLRGQPEIGLLCKPRCAYWCTQTQPSTNADADPDEEGSDDEWFGEGKAEGRIGSAPSTVHWSVWWLRTIWRKTEAIPIPFIMTWKSKASKRTILSAFGAGASACRDALDLAEYTRAMLCEVVIGGNILPDEWREEHMPVRAIIVCQSLFDRLARDASVPEDRGTALTVASLRERCSAGVGRDQNRSGLMWVPTRVQLADGLTKSSVGVFLRNALTSGTAQLHEESTKVFKKKQIVNSSKPVQGAPAEPMDLEQKDWWQ